MVLYKPLQGAGFTKKKNLLGHKYQIGSKSTKGFWFTRVIFPVLFYMVQEKPGILPPPKSASLGSVTYSNRNANCFSRSHISNSQDALPTLCNNILKIIRFLLGPMCHLKTKGVCTGSNAIRLAASLDKVFPMPFSTSQGICSHKKRQRFALFLQQSIAGQKALDRATKNIVCSSKDDQQAQNQLNFIRFCATLTF